jgi:hypothetical protein
LHVEDALWLISAVHSVINGQIIRCDFQPSMSQTTTPSKQVERAVRETASNPANFVGVDKFYRLAKMYAFITRNTLS